MDENQENGLAQETLPSGEAGDTGTETAVDPGVQAESQGVEGEGEGTGGELEKFLDGLSVGEAARKDEQSAESQFNVSSPQETGYQTESADSQGNQAVSAGHATGNQGDEESIEEVEKQLLAEVKSERGQARIKRLLSGNRALQADYDQTRQTVDGFANMIRSTGMNQQEFTDTMRYCQLVGSGDEASLKQALQMLDEQRNAICLRLGIDAPGANPFQKYPDIDRDVKDMVITPEYGRELVKAREAQAAEQARREQLQQQQQFQAHRQQVLGNFQQQAWAFVQHKAKTDPNFKAKEAALVEAFKSQNLAQRFNPEHPETWIPQLEMLYDVIPAQQARQPVRPQALRSRPSSLGNPQVTAPYGSVERTGQILDSLGL